MTVQKLKLAECAMLTKGKPPAELPYFGDDAVPYLSPEYLRGKGIAEPAKPAANAVRVKDGQTILLWDGSNAGEVFRARSGLLASTMTLVSHGEEFEPEYFCYATKRWEAYLKGQTSGSGIPHVDKEVLGKLEILKLPPDEQKLVANMLNKLDRAIEQTEALIAKQQRIKTGLMQDLLTKGIDERGNIRSEATHAFKDSPLGRIPVEWETKALGAIVNVIDCKHYTPAYVAEGIPIIRPRNIKESGFDLTNLDFVTEDDYRLLTDKHEPGKGDIVFSRNASFGIPVYVRGMDRFCIGQDVVVMTHRSVATHYVYYALKSDNVVRQILNVSGGSTFGRIDLRAIRNLIVPFPSSKSEQNEIAERLSYLDDAIDTSTQERTKLHSLKSGLMHDLLTGERRVTPLLALAATQ